VIYLDTSCLLKLLYEEIESAAVRAAVAKEEVVVVSSLVEVEAEIQFRAEYEGGRIRRSQWRRNQVKLAALRNFDPFEFRHLPGAVFTTAVRQVRHPDCEHCRPADRLHLAAMEELGVNRLMTVDIAQAKAAEALGFSVVSLT